MHVKDIIYGKFRCNMELQNNIERTRSKGSFTNMKITSNGSYSEEET